MVSGDVGPPQAFPSWLVTYLVVLLRNSAVIKCERSLKNMQEKQKIQSVPVKVYRSTDRITVATPLPGLQPEDILVTVTEEGHLVIHGEVRGMLKDIKELLVDEWSVGEYHRALELADPVDGSQANATYGNGVLVVSLPRAAYSTAAVLKLEKVGLDHGERVGLAGHVQIKETALGWVPVMKDHCLVPEVQHNI